MAGKADRKNLTKSGFGEFTSMKNTFDYCSSGAFDKVKNLTNLPTTFKSTVKEQSKIIEMNKLEGICSQKYQPF